ncbi:hypothetical protein [Nocardia sp. NPDC052316]|uniref:hypothetical protein n=1 Tax=Nocardia sp. NPDC052316 TaxID=3364329 RepID=UPI0037C7C8B0
MELLSTATAAPSAPLRRPAAEHSVLGEHACDILARALGVQAPNPAPTARENVFGPLRAAHDAG